MDIKLHHFSKRIVKEKFDIAIDLFEKLGFKLDKKWNESDGSLSAIFKFPNKNVYFQIISSENKPLKTESKRDSHIGFISKNPEKDLIKIEKWAFENNLKFIKNSWSDREFYFDCSEIFIDFVVEIMHTSVTTNFN